MTLPRVVGFETSGLMSDDQVLELLRGLPPRHVSNPHLMDIQYIDEVKLSNPMDRRRNPTLVMGECEINIEARSAEIWIYRQKRNGNDDPQDFRDSLYHEIAHGVFELVLTRQEQRRWRRIHGEETGFIWTEAGRDPVEHFCDMYSSYMTQRPVMRKRFPAEYSFMGEVFRKGGHND